MEYLTKKANPFLFAQIKLDGTCPEFGARTDHRSDHRESVVSLWTGRRHSPTAARQHSIPQHSLLSMTLVSMTSKRRTTPTLQIHRLIGSESEWPWPCIEGHAVNPRTSKSCSWWRHLLLSSWDRFRCCFPAQWTCSAWLALKHRTFTITP